MNALKCDFHMSKLLNLCTNIIYIIFKLKDEKKSTVSTT